MPRRLYAKDIGTKEHKAYYVWSKRLKRIKRLSVLGERAAKVKSVDSFLLKVERKKLPYGVILMGFHYTRRYYGWLPFVRLTDKVIVGIKTDIQDIEQKSLNWLRKQPGKVTFVRSQQPVYWINEKGDLYGCEMIERRTDIMFNSMKERNRAARMLFCGYGFTETMNKVREYGTRQAFIRGKPLPLDKKAGKIIFDLEVKKLRRKHGNSKDYKDKV